MALNATTIEWITGYYRRIQYVVSFSTECLRVIIYRLD